MVKKLLLLALVKSGFQTSQAAYHLDHSDYTMPKPSIRWFR